MRALLLAGHGSLRRGAGAAMLRVAARLRERGAAPLVAAGCFNYSRPSVDEALDRLVVRGATEVVAVPYLLGPGYFSRVVVPRALAAAAARHPGLATAVAEPLGDHQALAALALLRADAAGGGALLIIAHGTPDDEANAPIRAVVRRITDARAARGEDAPALLSFLNLNAPLLADGIDALAAAGARRIVALPYFLQLGDHAAEDVPLAIHAARERHPALTIALAEPLGYHPLLADAVADRYYEMSRKE